MKARQWLMTSVGLNVLLGGVVLQAVLARAGHSERPPVPGFEIGLAPEVRRLANELLPAAVPIEAPFSWRQVESADYLAYIENLRAIGCPEATIRDIIVADVNELYAGRVRELVDGVTGRFWNLMLDKEQLEDVVEQKLKELNALDDERAELFEVLIGERNPPGKVRELQEEMDQRTAWSQTLDFLSDDRLAGFLEIKDRFRSARLELEQSGRTLSEDERRQGLQALGAEEDRQIKALFTPQELDEYKLRTAPEADCRLRLAGFDATEEELRAIVRANLNKRGAAGRKPAEEQIRLALGDERFAAYQRASDAIYQQTLRITERFDLPPETAAQVYQLQKVAETEARRVREDTKRSAEKRREILKVLQSEMENSLSEVLGSRAFAAAQKYQALESLRWFKLDERKK
jgi:hypothetical protein